MIKFFRKIRLKLLSENKFSKYLIYAIGEIILVVIGILIALQVNNWNGNIQNKKTEILLLKSLKQDLELDLKNLYYKMKFDSLSLASGKNLVKAIKENNLAKELKEKSINGINYSSLGLINRVALFHPQKGAYQSIVNKGIDIIENPTLRQDIVNLYDYRYQFTADYLQTQLDLQNETNQFLWNYAETTNNIYTKIPSDTIGMKKDIKFINILSHISEQYNEALSFYRINVENIESLLSQINKEINANKKCRKHNNGYK